MKTRSYRTSIGPRFSEGARHTWLLMERRGWSLANVLTRIETRTGSRPTGPFSRWMYGDQQPSAGWASRLELALGIRAALWGRPALAPFVPPAARKEAA